METSSKYIYWVVVFQKACLSFVMSYPTDADEAFVDALHLIHYPQADWAQRSEPIEKDHEEACC